MFLIKLILMALLVMLYGFLMYNKRGRRSNIRFVSVGLLLLSLLAIMFPAMTNQLAHLFGIGRGADLFFYLIIMFMLFMITGLRFRVIQLQQNVTLLTRQIAFMQAQSAERELNQKKDAQP